MEVSEHIAVLDREGARLAEAAEAAGLDTAVPPCPDWAVRDLVAHTGGVHRWATSYVLTGRERETTEAEEDELYFTAPGDDELLAWFRAGHVALVDALTSAGADLQCWTFLPAPSPLAFWARRQAHETAIHRVDAESAAGDVTRCEPAFAVDGIDELLLGMFARPRSRLVSDPPVSLAARATDAEVAWTIRVGPERREVTRQLQDADCVVAGPADRLYRLLWNRADPDGVEVAGDRTVLDLWRAKATVRWG